MLRALTLLKTAADDYMTSLIKGCLLLAFVPSEQECLICAEHVVEIKPHGKSMMGFGGA